MVAVLAMLWALVRVGSAAVLAAMLACAALAAASEPNHPLLDSAALVTAPT